MDALALSVAHRQTRTVHPRGSSRVMIFSDSTTPHIHARSGILPLVFPAGWQVHAGCGGMEGRLRMDGMRKARTASAAHVKLENPPPMGVVIGPFNLSRALDGLSPALWECIRIFGKRFRARGNLPHTLPRRIQCGRRRWNTSGPMRLPESA